MQSGEEHSFGCHESKPKYCRGNRHPGAKRAVNEASYRNKLLAAQEALAMASAVLGEIEALSAAEAPRLGPLQKQLANLQQKLAANTLEDSLNQGSKAPHN